MGNLNLAFPNPTVYLTISPSCYLYDSFTKGGTGNQKQLEAIATIKELAEFYEVVIYSDQQSDSDATVVDIQKHTVEDYFEELLEKWGIEWRKIRKIAAERLKEPLQQAGSKRPPDPTEDAAPSGRRIN